MAAGRIVLSQYMPARNRSDRLVAGAKLYVYENETTTLASIYADSGLTTPLANPVVANSSGQFVSIWGDTEELYSLSITGPNGESIGNPSVFDNYAPSAAQEAAASAEIASDAAATAVAAQEAADEDRIAAENARVGAEAAEGGAETAAATATAQLALVQAAAAAGVSDIEDAVAAEFYDDAAAGIAGTVDGEWFKTVEDERIVTYKNVAEVAVEKSVAPKVADYDALSAQVVDFGVDLDGLNLNLGADYDPEAEVTYGSTVPDTLSLAAAGTFGNGVPTPTRGFIHALNVRLSNTGVGEVHIYEPDGAGGYTVLYIQSAPSLASGVNTITLTAPVYAAAGSIVHYAKISGGSVRYVTGGGPRSYLDQASQVQGDPMAGTLTNDSSATYAVSYDFVGYAEEPIATRLSALEGGESDASLNLQAGIGADGSAVEVTTIGTTTPATSSLGSYLSTIGPVEVCERPSYLETFSCRLSLAAVVRVVAYDVSSSGAYTVSAVSDSLTALAGVNTFTRPFGTRLFPANTAFKFSRVSGSGLLRFVSGGAGSIVVSGDSGSLAVGDVGTASANTNTFAVEFTVRSSDEETLAEKVAALEAAAGAALRPSKAIVSTLFPGTSLPANWTESGGWTVNNGLIGPASGPGWGDFAVFGVYSSLLQRKWCVRFIPSDAASTFGIVATSTIGGYAAVDGVASKIRLYEYDGTAPTTAGAAVSGAEATIPALVIGRPYTLEMRRDNLAITVTLTDAITLEQLGTFTSLQYGSSKEGRFHGPTGVMQTAGGAVTVASFDCHALYPENAHCIILGDSNTEGNALPAGVLSWGSRLADLRGEHDVAISARGGETADGFVTNQMADALNFTSAKYVIINLGTNAGASDWRTAMTTLIAASEAIGAEVILCTYPPRPTMQTTINDRNADVMGGYFGRYRYIDFASALSDSNDRVTWNSAYDIGDNIHYNSAGHAQIVLQVQADVPAIFGGTS